MRNFNLFPSPNIDRVIKSKTLRGTGNVARMDEGRSAFKILTSKYTRPKRRWEGSIIIDLKEIVVNTRNWID